MKKRIFLVTMVFVVAMLFMAMSPPESSAGCFDIVWDGYSDGMHVCSSGLVFYGNRTGGASNLMIGDIALKPSATSLNDISLGLSTMNSGDPSLPQTFWMKFDQTWELWINTGGSVMLLNSGTWSVGTPDEGDGGPVSDQ